jgi:glycosyltransferase involved in cell wall biosynthesis
MRVCLIATGFPPDNYWGIEGSYAYELALGLRKLGHTVEVIALSPDVAGTAVQEGVLVHRIIAQFGDIPGEQGLIAKCMPNNKFVFAATRALWTKFAELHAAKPFDVVDVPELLATGVLPAVSKAIPTVVRLSGQPSKHLAANFHDSAYAFDSQLLTMLKQMSIFSAEAIIAPSEELANELVEKVHCPQEKLTVIKHPVNVDKFTLPQTNTKAQTIVFAGWQPYHANSQVLKEVIAKVLLVFPQATFAIVSDEDHFFNENKDTISAPVQTAKLSEFSSTLEGLEERVTYYPHAPTWQLLSILKTATIAVVDLTHYYSPYTCLKIMSCGKAVVALLEARAKQYIVDKKSGLICKGSDAQTVANSILTLLQDTVLAGDLARHAHDSAMKQFSQEEIAKQTRRVYEHAIHQFSSSKKSAMYFKDQTSLLKDAEALYLSLDKMLYDYFFVNSLDFRLNHWLTKIKRQIKDDPGAIAQKLLKR